MQNAALKKQDRSVLLALIGTVLFVNHPLMGVLESFNFLLYVDIGGGIDFIFRIGFLLNESEVIDVRIESLPFFDYPILVNSVAVFSFPFPMVKVVDVFLDGY